MKKRLLEGQVAVVTGGSRGVGKGVAVCLGEAGATVYVTGRTHAPGGSVFPGSIAETADEVTRRGGRGIAVPCDHADDEAVKRVFERIYNDEKDIDILVNNVFAAPDRMPVNVPFWQLDEGLWDGLLRVGLRSHYVASRCVAGRMAERGRGLIVCTSSGGSVRYTFNVPFGVQKAGVDKLAKDMAHDLEPFHVASLVIWPGFIKSEKFLAQPDRMPAALAQRIMAHGESAEFAGRAVVGLATDPKIMEKTGRLHLVAELAQEYGFTDIDGRMPAAPSRT